MTTNLKISAQTKNEWHSDPNNWKYQIFYYNLADERLFPPKKIKALGWTVNFANVWSIFAMIILIALILLLIFLFKQYYEN